MPIFFDSHDLLFSQQSQRPQMYTWTQVICLGLQKVYLTETSDRVEYSPCPEWKQNYGSEYIKGESKTHNKLWNYASIPSKSPPPSAAQTVGAMSRAVTRAWVNHFRRFFAIVAGYFTTNCTKDDVSLDDVIVTWHAKSQVMVLFCLDLAPLLLGARQEKDRSTACLYLHLGHCKKTFNTLFILRRYMFTF